MAIRRNTLNRAARKVQEDDTMDISKAGPPAGPRMLRRTSLGLPLALWLAAIAPAQAQQSAPAAAAATTTNDVTLNLIHLLVQQQIITPEQADALFKQAQQQASHPAPASPAPGTSASAPGAPAAPSIHVTYVPEIIREQIKREAEKDILKSGKGIPVVGSQLPDWLRRLKITGDLRARYEWNWYSSGNSPNFINFNAINQGSPFDVNPSSNNTLPPFLNTTENRQRMRLRARIAFTDQVNNDLEVGIRLSTGSTSSPVSPNQTSGNSLANDPITLDRAYFDYHPLPWAKLVAGRFADPWFRTDLVWYKDLNFDGVMLAASKEVLPDLKPFATVGIFPVENSAFDFPGNSITKTATRNKWLYGAQAGASWLVADNQVAKLGVAYYHYENLEGQTSTLCNDASAATPCSTDSTRPGFLQQGNTLYAIRNVIAGATASTPQYQYFGLASPFHILDVTGRYDIAIADPVHLVFDAEFATNLAFDGQKVAALSPVNNIGASNTLESGSSAYLARVTIGHPEVREWRDWNVSVEYKYLEGDSVPDAFTDPDFHSSGTATGTVGGTNAKGYVIGASFGLAHNFWFSTKYDSSTEISGQPFAVDTLQTDLNARF